jgi:hypothetical protein
MRESVIVMSKRIQTKPDLGRNRDESVAVEDDVWCWGVIFSAAAFAALCVAILFSIGTL